MKRDITEHHTRMLRVEDVIKTVSVEKELLFVLFVKRELWLIMIRLNVVSRCI